MPELKKFAVRFIHNGAIRTYLVEDVATPDAICTAIDLLEQDIPEIFEARGLSVIAKAWPDGAHLADAEHGPLIDAIRRRPAELVAA
jgi:hypothetical protein